MIFLVTASTYAVTKPLIASQKEYTALKKKFNELIYDENIIQYLFQQELHLTDIDEVSKLSIGNTNAETCLTVVFSPICVSCIKELQILMRILQRKDNIKLDLIFLLDKKKHPESLIIAKHLLSDYQKSPEQFITILQKYVDDYPISKNKIMLLNTILILMRKKNGAETTSFTVHPSYLLTGINCQTITTLKI